MEPQSKDAISQVFKSIDKDKSGYLDKQEIA
jgi:Ca2+-binding EF-hand superfamily protein